MEKPAVFSVSEVTFLFGVPGPEKIPPQRFSEVAIIGRSNVGKSSLINRFVGRKVARVSGTPGCTLELNFFRIVGTGADGTATFTLVDLPGFGFAKVSKQERGRISRAIVNYIRNRKQLQCVLLLNDPRREVGEDEMAVRDTCSESGVPVIVVATKVDTLNQSERVLCTRSLAASYNLEPQDLVLSGEKTSVNQLWSRVLPYIENIPLTI